MSGRGKRRSWWPWTTRAELRDEAALWRRRCEAKNAEVHEAHVRIKAVRLEVSQQMHEAKNRADVAEARLRQAEIKLRLAAEPVRREECTKVRLHRRAEAEEWAERVARGTGAQAGDFNVYRCRVCPRSPVTLNRYFHIGHPGNRIGTATKAATMDRMASRNREAREAGTTIAQRVDPRVLAVLRGEIQEG